MIQGEGEIFCCPKRREMHKVALQLRLQVALNRLAEIQKEIVNNDINFCCLGREATYGFKDFAFSHNVPIVLERIADILEEMELTWD